MTRSGGVSRLIKLAVLAGIVVFAASLVMWWRQVYNSPVRTFERMLSTMLSTDSVTRQTIQQSPDERLDQMVTIAGSPTHQVTSRNVLAQGLSTQIVTQSIGTPTDDYIQYESIKTAQTSSTGEPLDFSQVTGKWGRNQADPSTGGQAELYGQTVYGVVPIGKLPLEARQKLIHQIFSDNVYSVDFSTVERRLDAGRPIYSYQVSVAPVSYVKMLKSFDELLGLDQLKELDPSRYQGTTALRFKFTIDVWSGQLTQVSYDSSARDEHYGAYGVHRQVELPADTIPISELQQRLQQVQ